MSRIFGWFCFYFSIKIPQNNSIFAKYQKVGIEQYSNLPYLCSVKMN